MKKTDLAYTAGIIDGEGCISLNQTSYKYKGKKHRRIEMSVRVGSADEWLCQYLKFAYGGSIVCHNVKKKKEWSDSWEWAILCNQASAFLKHLLPYLYLKRPQAELAITFQSNKGGRGKPRPPEHVALEEAQHILMKSLKRKGKTRRGQEIN